MIPLHPRASCCKCGTRRNISPYMSMFWICKRCSIAEVIELTEKFLKEKGVYTAEERRVSKQDLKRLKKQLKKLEASGIYPRRWLPRDFNMEKER